MAEVEKLETSESLSPIEIYDKEIKAAKKELEKFHEQGKRANDRFVDDRGTSDRGRYNLFWSNVNVLLAAMYARQPKADVSRRNKDPNDDVGRVAGEMMERILNLDMESQSSDIDTALRQCVQDRLIPGLGQVWLRYDPTFVKQPNPAYAAPQPAEASALSPADPSQAEIQAPPEAPGGAAPESEEEEIEVIGDERVATDYVYWKDFIWSPARTWAEVRWVARAIYMTREELVKKFGELIGEAVPLNATKGKGGSQLLDNDPWQKAQVWEMWKKAERKVCWHVEGHDKLLGEVADPLQLDGFFPCPVPLAGNITTTQWVPKSDYEMLRDQYEDLDLVSQRITLLEEAIRVVGVYDKNTAELKGMLSSAGNVMIAADNWAMFAEKGGIKGAVDWFPIEQVVNALIQLREAKNGIIQDLYNLYGISDIMRGATNPNETLGAQELKVQFGSVRTQNLQGGLAAFVQQILAIKAEIIATHFQPETIKRQSLIEQTPDAQLADQAVARLKDKRMAHYSLQVDPDTMAMTDYAMEQRSRTECITAVGQFMAAAMPLAQMKPESVPFLLQILQWFLAGFKAGKQIEGVLDQAVRSLTAAPTPPDPMQERMKQAQVVKVESEGQKNQASAAKSAAEAKVLPIKSAIEVVKDLKEIQQPAQPPGVPQGVPQ